MTRYFQLLRVLSIEDNNIDEYFVSENYLPTNPVLIDFKKEVLCSAAKYGVCSSIAPQLWTDIDDFAIIV